MKSTLIAFLVVVALTFPVSAGAQDWVMDWHSSSAAQVSWDLSGHSAATLTPRPDIGPTNFSQIYHPDGAVYEMHFTYQGHEFGGLVAQGNYQSLLFSVPANPNVGGVRSDASGGTFNLVDGHFTNSASVGFGHNYASWSASGTLASVSTAPEPTVLLLSAAGLIGAAVLRRSRRA